MADSVRSASTAHFSLKDKQLKSAALNLLRVTIVAAAMQASCHVRAEDGVDTALIVSVDVSGSVSEARYQLQMQGIAGALEDPTVLAAISSGPRNGILFSMVAWADKPQQVIGWTRISNKADAASVAARVRALPHTEGEFTCFGRMFDLIATDVIPNMPMSASRTIVDVSGDGIDNCTDIETLHTLRSAVLRQHASINGLPILVPGENDFVGSGAFRAPGYGLHELSKTPDQEVTTLDRWYAKNIVAGPGSFLLPAEGYGDFARALRRKFLMEISSNDHQSSVVAGR